MNTIEDVIKFVNNQAIYHSKQAKRLSSKAERGDPAAKRRVDNHKQLVSQFEETKAFIEKHCNSVQISDAKIVSPHLHFLPQDIEDLPKELLDELNISESDSLELAIFEALKKAGGQLPVDKILIQIYRDTGKIHTRKQVASKLYRMASKGRLVSDSEHRGVYGLTDDFNEEQMRLFENSEEKAQE